MPMLKNRVFSNDEMGTWQTVLSTHEKTRKDQVVDIFHNGLATLDIQANKIPQLWEINDTLEKISGFNGVYVTGLEDGKSFYPMLSKRYRCMFSYSRSCTCDYCYFCIRSFIH